MTKNGQIELMAPAGNFEALQAAIENGADSVYFGVEQLNMRARASLKLYFGRPSRNCKTLSRKKYKNLSYAQYHYLRPRFAHYQNLDKQSEKI